jgi:hypothetical protein
MMKKTIYLIAVAVITFGGCKKDSDPTPVPTPTPTPVDQLCDGNGSSVWIPLDSSNMWEYEYKIMGFPQTGSTITAGTTATHGAHTYRMLGSSGLMAELQLREDATTHDIYKYYSSTGADFMEVPNSPVLNQTWPTTSGTTRTVTNINASVTTGGCTYTGVLEITEVGFVTVKEYYKRGLGMIKSIGGSDIYELADVELK